MPLEQHLAAGDRAGAGHQIDDRERGHRLSRAGFADQAGDRAAFDGETDVVDRFSDAPAVQRELHLEIPDFKQIAAHAALLSDLGSRMS